MSPRVTAIGTGLILGTVGASALMDPGWLTGLIGIVAGLVLAVPFEWWLRRRE